MIVLREVWPWTIGQALLLFDFDRERMWQCTTCNEQVADKYGFCWNCGARDSNAPSAISTVLPESCAAKKDQSNIQRLPSPAELAEPTKQHMNLPAWITRVCYKVAGSYGYRGDLIITQEAISYFPHTDLRKKWEAQPEVGGMFAMLGPTGSLFGSAVNRAAASLEGETISLFVEPSPIIDLNSVWHESKSLEELQTILEAYFVRLKQHGSKGKSLSDLPTPKRYKKAEVKNLSLTSFGILKFDTQCDDHIFKVGIINKPQNALEDSGFITQAAQSRSSREA